MISLKTSGKATEKTKIYIKGGNSMGKYNLGLVSISFRSASVEELIKAVKDAGLACIEWGSDVHAPCNDTEKLQRIAKLQKENNIFCSSYGTYFRLGNNFPDEFIDYINASDILETDILRIWCGVKDSNLYTVEEKNKLIYDAKYIADLAAKSGKTICLECHNNTLTDTIESALEIINAVNSESFKMYWQPNQLHDFEWNINYARSIAPYAKHIHVFNWSATTRFPLKDAVEIWKEYLNCFSGERVLLLEFMPDDKLSSLQQEADALKLITEV